MKPTRGRVSPQPVRQGWLGLSVYGALARTVADSALMLDAIHGALPGDADSAPLFDGSYVEAARKPATRLRVALSRKLPPGLIAPVSDDQRSAWESMGRLLSELGHEVVGRDPAYGMGSLEFTQTWIRGIYEQSCEVPDRTLLERSSRQMASAGRLLVPLRRRERLLKKRARSAARIGAIWGEVDVLVTPGLATTAIAGEGGHGKSAATAFNRASRFTPWTPPFNLTGQPAIAVPAGFGSDGLPLSVQLVGRPGSEDLLYALAGQIETARPWAEQRPSVV
jgi:amidase